MNYHNGEKNNDRLRGEFTAWLEKLVIRVKLDYIRKHPRYLDVISIDELSEETLSAYDDKPKLNPAGFDFDDVKLEEAFMKLTVLRRRILTMLFVDEMTPEEIAGVLGCTIEAVYNNRSRALKKLREALRKEDE